MLTETGARIFIAALFIIEANWKQPKCPSTERGTNKLGHSHTME